MQNNVDQSSTDQSKEDDIITVTRYDVSAILGWAAIIVGILSFVTQQMEVVSGSLYMAILGVLLGGFTLLLAGPIKKVKCIKAHEVSFDDMDRLNDK